MKPLSVTALLGICAATVAVVLKTTTGGVDVVKPQVPGVVNKAVTQLNIKNTICKRGWTSTIRPPQSYTFRAKVGQIRLYKYSDTDPSHYQEDHLISLELGGSPDSYNNLWPQPLTQARIDDRVENKLRENVCNGSTTLYKAQRAEINWKRKHG